MSDSEAASDLPSAHPHNGANTREGWKARDRCGPPGAEGDGAPLLATCYREIGDTQRAYAYYSRAIQLDPTNSELLTARGMLMYGTDPNSTADFEQAIRVRIAIGVARISTWPISI